MARMSIRPQTPAPFLSKEDAGRFLAIPTPPPSPLTPVSSPLPQIPSLPLPISPPLPISAPLLPTSPTHPLGYRAAMIRLRAGALSTSHSLPLPPPIILSHIRSDASPLGTPPSGTLPLLPIPAPTSSPPLLLPSIDRRADKPEVCLPPQKRLCIAFGPRYEDETVEAMQDRPAAGVMDIAELSQRMTDFATTVRQDTDEINRRFSDAQDTRAVLSDRLNLLYRDRRSYAYTALLMERDARMSAGRDYSFVSSRPRSTGIACSNTETDGCTTGTSDRAPETAGTR
ncbi:hypothetical protein Tco_0970436 [Tanacetum coccineum]